MAERIRVQKAIADAGIMSRRAAEKAIRDQRVTVDGSVAVLGDRVVDDTQVVCLDGAPLPAKPQHETHLLDKPVGVISASRDPQGRCTVVDLIDSDARLYPAGRLDADSEGLILVTNDGRLANRVTHPRYGITKTYTVLVDAPMTRHHLDVLESGLQLDDGLARAVKARLVDSTDASSTVELVMGEGRNREIRRMMARLGLSVTRLRRTRIGNIGDRSLEPGQSRLLSAEETLDLISMGDR